MNSPQLYKETHKPSMAQSLATATKYHKWVFSAIKKYLMSQGITLEVGAGHYGYTKLLLEVSRKVIVSDIDPDAAARIKTNLSMFDNVDVNIMDGIEAHKIREPLDNIVAINIIEHISDDDRFIKDCFSVLKNGGRLVVFAPAFPCLFSTMDREAGHFRRYLKKDLRNLLHNNGFAIISADYFNFAGFWGWLLNKYLKSGVDSEATNAQVMAFDRCVWLFKLFEPFSFCCGQSVIVAGERP